MSGLELIRHAPEGDTRPVDLLLVHGMSVGAWLWQEGALPYFADAGYGAWALNLSGHAAGMTGRNRQEISLDHYSADLAAALDHIDRPCVVIAHSLGGAVVQNLLRQGHSLAGTVLLCSVPPYGLWRASIEMFWRNPELWETLGIFSLLGLAYSDLEVLRRNLFPNGIDDAAFDRLMSRAQDESWLALQATLGWHPIAPPPLSQRNVLVIGGAKDAFVPVTDLWLTAAYYGVTPHVIKGGGHMMMFEPAGREAGQIVLDWLADLEGDAV